jgi:Raf kinase inhibitor-like YbhB/YbcL family protein
MIKSRMASDIWGIGMKLSSPDFSHNGKMPSYLTCDGADISPELHIADVPLNAKSLVLIMDDPDAPRGTWTHWVVFNIPPETRKISKGNEPEGIQGVTDFRSLGYGGPCPPSGQHRYFFKVYALSGTLPLKEGATKQQVLQAMQGKIIAQAELMGLYERQ